MRNILIILVFFLNTLGIAAAVVHPRVIELEDTLSREVSEYFHSRHPGEPFFATVKIEPLRRTLKVETESEHLPYFSAEEGEDVDEWDDARIGLAELRSRITRISLDLSVSEKFTDSEIASLKEEVSSVLRIIPARDTVTIERKFKVPVTQVPQYVYWLISTILGASALLGFMMRWSLGSMKSTRGEAQVPAQPPREAAQAVREPQSQAPGLPGDVTFHDPIKTLDVVQVKIRQIEGTQTFPTLKDMLLLSELESAKLGALVYEFSNEAQAKLYKMGHGQSWLEAFCSPGRIDQRTLEILDRMTRDRTYSAGSREMEDLLVQIWRMGEKAVQFLKRIDQEHAYLLLDLVPKSLSLGLAKKIFPGGWARVLSNRQNNLVLDPSLVKNYLKQSFDSTPWLEPKLLETYKKDREILAYLDIVSIDDERDIYSSLDPSSVIHELRAPFYKVFELSTSEFKALTLRLPLEKWALVVMNSSRTYMKKVSDSLDEKKRLVFSDHLKRFDRLGVSPAEQTHWRRQLANIIQAEAVKQTSPHTLNSSGVDHEDQSQSA